ncbi:MAG TPA: hypothetical protein VJI68_00780 [Candidatus Nanoarchaeia archaeon]|nr:hypothetical protein [Candidatus Nanoarchaeia archaeon]
MLKDKIESFWNKNYKWLMCIPIALVLLSFIQIGIQTAQTGDFFHKDISLRGGIAATVYTDKEFTEQQIQEAIEVPANVKRLGDLTTGKQIGFVIEVSDLSDEQLKERIEKKLGLTLNEDNFSKEITEPKLGQSFFKQLLIALIFSLVLMGITVFATFRKFVPSMTVILATITDIVITIAILNIFNVNISSAGVVGFLLIIGYSVDNNILLTNYTLRKKEDRLFDRMYKSMKTGMLVTIIAVVVMLIGLLLSNSVVIREVFLIILLALIIDIFTTYLTNTGILWIYCKKKNIQ